MAWNEPGGGDKRPNDPWGNGNKNQGPPDLDELLSKFFERLNGLFGGSGGKGGGFDKGLIGLIAIVAFVAYGLLGFTTIEEGKLGVLQQFGAYKETKGSGPTFIFKPFQKLTIVNVENVNKIDNAREREGSREMLTQDENIIILKYEVQFKIQSAEDFVFNVVNPVETLEQAADSAIREVVGRNKLDFITTEGRSLVAAQTKTLIQEIIAGYETGISVQRVILSEAQYPADVKSAIDDVAKAREDRESYINEAEKYSNQVLPEAGGQAAKLEEEAKGYKVQVEKRAEGEASRFTQLLTEYKKAPRVTRDRLYIDAVETMLGQTSKVVVDTEGGNSMLYLPLDKMMNQKPVTNNTLYLPTVEPGQGSHSVRSPSRSRVREAR